MKIREHGLTGLEQQKLLEARRYFNIDANKTSKHIVGILIIESGEELPLISGEHGGPWGGTQRGGIPRGKGSGANAYSVKHIEGHAASIMHNREISYGVLLIEKAPCGACDPSIPNLLPANSRLDVVFPDSTSTYWSAQRDSGKPYGLTPSRGTTV